MDWLADYFAFTKSIQLLEFEFGRNRLEYSDFSWISTAEHLVDLPERAGWPILWISA